ncbi:AmmeMemoRadiSam system protein A [Psychromonas aquimarina]|uniref:AmmeMemoRadiSam system protein A n=1 Tax=Psychromonas aquimarina TaxID=444919 RepID=UPI0004269AAF|nr:AmmeMemoRadiSam system protein A [Psychromonas aquimarina]
MPVSFSINFTTAEQNELVNLVKQVLETTTREHTLVLPEPPVSAALLTRRACFVTLYINKQLRGCIGTYGVEKPLWLNVCEYSYYSACQDRRFVPVQSNELPYLSFEISVLSELEPLKNSGEQALLKELKVGSDGLLLKEEGGRSAIFLPTVWHSLPTPITFVQALKQKGGWHRNYWSEDLKLYRFSTFVIEG